ncbi:MAG: UDP-3-O-(3-hydroxymyristoyl)glucosamine N-acyltransferase, partial [Lentisphaeraceae bacterium]|nr:UDP-3-O-(3-hydroxymyristoyl)glucosamine N-acyltransferase [Lentisphaeraceae bacterium]
GVASLEDATPTQLSFLGNSKYAPQVKASEAGIILVPQDYQTEDEKCYIVCKDASAAFSQIIDAFAPEPIKYAPGIHPSAYVADDAVIGEGCHIAPNAVIEGGAKIGKNSVICGGAFIGHEAVLGENCLIQANVSIRERCIIGINCIIHSGTAIGSDGFGFIPGANGHTKIPQVGIVELADDVEVGSCVCIDRARFGKTKIGQGTKIDNLVQIAHNVEIGKHCFVVAQTGIAGSSKLGNFVIMAAQSGLGGHLTVGDGVTITARAGAMKDIPAGQQVYGFPAIPKREFARQSLRIKKIERFEKELAVLKNQIEELKSSAE